VSSFFSFFNSVMAVLNNAVISSPSCLYLQSRYELSSLLLIFLFLYIALPYRPPLLCYFFDPEENNSLPVCFTFLTSESTA
jgi:hypothetical protein